ncbi:hypothetical protein [Tahibacter sp.]|uniref:hypothetical protein n=1 Tax=Tahibacter sp. TaxID=2056211 RepID=UPI0028C37868|nr:hypothetical protein [Tahibacter sp.]
MSPTERRRATVWALFFAIAIYAFSWQILGQPPEWLRASGDLPQWPATFDLLLTVPAVYWWLHRRDRRRAALGALALAGVGIWVASVILPDTSGPAWSALRLLRNVGLGLGLVVALEVGIVVSMLRLVVRLARDRNPDYALREGVQQHFGTTLPARVVAFDMRMWLHVFAGARRAWHYAGDTHFSYHRKDGNASNQQAFLILMLIDLPIAHAILTVFASATTAWIVTLLTVLSLALMFGHYRATLRCPVSLDSDTLYLRYGLAVAEAAVPLAAVAQATPCRDDLPRRAPGVLRLNEAGTPNVHISLHEPVVVVGWFGIERRVDTIVLGIDQPREFLAGLNARLAAREPVVSMPVHGAASTTNE